MIAALFLVIVISITIAVGYEIRWWLRSGAEVEEARQNWLKSLEELELEIDRQERELNRRRQARMEELQ